MSACARVHACWSACHCPLSPTLLPLHRSCPPVHPPSHLPLHPPTHPLPPGEYWDTLAYEWDGTPTHNQDAHRQRTVNWINAAGGLATAFDITLKGIMHAGVGRLAERMEGWQALLAAW